MTEDPRISEIDAVLDAPRDPFDDGGEKLARIRAILDRPAPAPRVFFPGEQIPAGVWFVAEGNHNGITTPALSNGTRTVRVSPKLEVPVPTGEQFKAAVDWARAEREANR